MVYQRWVGLAHFRWICLVALMGSPCFHEDGIALAQNFDERFEDWPIDLKIPGTLVVADEVDLTANHLRELLGDTKAQTLSVIGSGVLPLPLGSAFKEAFASVSLLKENEIANETLADVIAWYADNTEDANATQRHHHIASTMRSHLQSGKTLIVAGRYRKVVSRVFIATVHDAHPSVSNGLNLLPDCVIETDLSHVDACRTQILSVLASHPQCVGIGLEQNTSLVLRGRKIRVVGDGRAVFTVAANDQQAVRTHAISQQQSRQQNPNEWMIDLTQWRRVAIDRTLAPFPPSESPPPFVESGTLMIVGGGGLPHGMMEEFIEIAGGLENARLVYVPCSEEDIIPKNSGMIATWRDMGVRHATLVHTKDRLLANQDSQFLEPLRDATGIWFGGGRQWNFADSYYGTTAHRLMKDVLKRGGIIGGSSAGASIQARYLARATPIENLEIMAPGYERGGLGFIDGVAIDQHFTQRRRQPDMTQLVNRYPQLLGIGIDESTAIVVKKSIATIHGSGKVHFYDRRQKADPDRPDHISLSNGQAYELSQRQVLDLLKP